MDAPTISIESLPGEDLIRKGMIDLDRDQVTVESLLVSIAWSRLAASGLAITRRLALEEDAELVLYDLLRESHGERRLLQVQFPAA